MRQELVALASRLSQDAADQLDAQVRRFHKTVELVRAAARDCGDIDLGPDDQTSRRLQDVVARASRSDYLQSLQDLELVESLRQKVVTGAIALLAVEADRRRQDVDRCLSTETAAKAQRAADHNRASERREAALRRALSPDVHRSAAIRFIGVVTLVLAVCLMPFTSELGAPALSFIYGALTATVLWFAAGKWIYRSRAHSQASREYETDVRAADAVLDAALSSRREADEARRKLDAVEEALRALRRGAEATPKDAESQLSTRSATRRA
jgi:hypothetical protein